MATGGDRAGGRATGGETGGETRGETRGETGRATGGETGRATGRETDQATGRTAGAPARGDGAPSAVGDAAVAGPPGLHGVLIVGCGYSGRAIAAVLSARGVPCWGTTRSAAGVDGIRAAGAEPLVWWAGAPLPAEVLRRVDAVIDTAGPPWGGGEDPTAAVLASLEGAPLRSFVYLSSTSVYGDRGDEVVDEETPCEPTSPAGVRRLAVERLLLARHAAEGLPVVILRLPAIYGPGRAGLLERIRARSYAVIGDGAGLGNRIHVEDLAAAAVAAAERGPAGRVYVVCDDAPASRAEVADGLAAWLALPPPPRVPLDEARRTMDPSVVAMFSDSKRLSNARMKTELGVALRAPTWREGFASLL